MGQKLTSKALLFKEEYWGDDGKNEGFLTPCMDHVSITSDEYLSAMAKGKTAIRSFQNNVKLNYNESIMFEREYRSLCALHTNCKNHVEFKNLKTELCK